MITISPHCMFQHPSPPTANVDPINTPTPNPHAYLMPLRTRSLSTPTLSQTRASPIASAAQRTIRPRRAMRCASTSSRHEPTCANVNPPCRPFPPVVSHIARRHSPRRSRFFAHFTSQFAHARPIVQTIRHAFPCPLSAAPLSHRMHRACCNVSLRPCRRPPRIRSRPVFRRSRCLLPNAPVDAPSAREEETEERALWRGLCQKFRLFRRPFLHEERQDLYSSHSQDVQLRKQVC